MLRRIVQRSWRLQWRNRQGTAGGFVGGSEGIGRASGDGESGNVDVVDDGNLYLYLRGSRVRRFASSSSSSSSGGGSSSSSSNNNNNNSSSSSSSSSSSDKEEKWRVIAIDRTGLVGGVGGGGGDGTTARSSSPSSSSSSSSAYDAAPAAHPGRSLAASIPVPPRLADTPMTRHIRALIQFRGGPITVAEFMKESLTNPTAGYYTTRAKEEQEERERKKKKGTKDDDADEEQPSSSSSSPSSSSSAPGAKIFGPRGDFVTSPDISQLMGDCVGVWAATEWGGALRRPRKVRVVELGPGRGTLLSDALRALAPLSRRGLFAEEVEVELVEVSAGLRRAQWSSLRCVSDAADGDGGSSVPPEEPQEGISRLFDDDDDDEGGGVESTSSGEKRKKRKTGIKVTWRSRLDDVPLDSSAEEESEQGKDAPRSSPSPSPTPSPTPTLYLAHEFFDALPVHQFVRVSGPRPPRGSARNPASLRSGKGGKGGSGGGVVVLPTSAAWRERLVDVADSSTSSALRFVLSPGETPASRWLLPRRLELMTSEERESVPQQLEVSGEAMAVAAALGERLSLTASSSSSPSPASVGSALIVDYGRFRPPYGDSLVAIRDHLPVADVLSSAGRADLSARVDFGALAAAAVDAGKKGGKGGNATGPSPSAITFYGPISQSSFLRGLGIAARLESLVEAAEEKRKRKKKSAEDGNKADEDFEKAVESLVEGARRLVAPDTEGGLGDTYQAMVIAPAGREEPPVPFR